MIKRTAEIYNLEIYKNEEFGKVRTILEKDKPYFCAKDIATSLGYADTSQAIRKHCKGVVEITTPTNGGNQKLKFIPEGDVYRLIIKSKLPKAEKFEMWIMDEVLPTVNRVGGYVVENREEEFVNNYLADLSEETKTLVIKELHSNNEKLKAENMELKEFYDTLLNTEDLLPMNVVAKELKFGVKRLYSFLRCKNIMFYKGKINIPYQRFMEQGLFKVKETPCKDGAYRPVTYATTKGLDYIRKMILKDSNVSIS